MEASRKKELQEAYKTYRPEMGVFCVQHRASGRTYLEATKNLKGKINSTVFQLNMDSYFLCKPLNKDWQTYGKDAFDVEILEKLEYKKEDDGHFDYSDDLELLWLEWVEKLKSEGKKMY